MIKKLFGRFFLVLFVAFSLSAVTAAHAQTYDEACKKGNDALAQKDYNAAIKEFSAAVTLNEEGPKAYLGRAIAEYNLGKFEEAMTDVNIVILFDTSSAQAYNISGLIREKTGQVAEAEKDYEKALLLKPDFDEAKINLANLRKKLGK